MFYLFTGTPSICDVALIRPSVRTGAPSPSGKALIARQVFMDSILIPSPAFAGVFFWNGGGWERMGFGAAKCWRNPRRFPMQTATGFFAPGRYTLAKDGIDLPVQRLGGGKYGNKRTSGGEAAALPPAGHRERIPPGVFGPGRGRGGLSAGRGVGWGRAVWAVRPLRRGGVTAAPGENDTGNVIYFFNPFLKERYEIRQQGYVEREGKNSENKDKLSFLKADLYDARFTWLSEALCRELVEEHLSHHGGGYRELAKEGYDSFSLLEDGKSQILVARRGKKVLVLYYQGREKLEDKAGVLGTILES